MALVVSVLLFFSLTSIICIFGYLRYVRPSRLIDQLTASTWDSGESKNGKRRSSVPITRWLEEIGNLLPISPQDAALTKRELISAGFRSRSAAPFLYGLKIVLSMALVLLALTVRDRFDSPMLRLISPLLGGAAGYCLPNFVLGRLVKRRREQIRFGLPDVLDLLVVCSEAGCGLDQAIVNVSRDLKAVHPAIADELSFVNMETMAGTNRAEALRNFARRTGEEEVKKLVAIMIQTDRFGTSVSEALRTQSDFLRVRRRQDAEERAGKVGVKLVFPIFFFCLPSLLIITAGPSMLQLFHNLLPMLRDLHSTP